MNCEKCGAEINENDKFCSNCGEKVKSNEEGSIFCEKCGAEIVDKNAKFCSHCGASVSTSAKRKKPKINSSTKKGKKIPIKTIIVIVVVIAIISCAIYMYLEQTTRDSTIDGKQKNYIGDNAFDSNRYTSEFTIIGSVHHKNIFGPVNIYDEKLNVTIKNDAGEIVSQKTIIEDKEYTFNDLPVGHYTYEVNYTGDYPSVCDRGDFILLTPEELQQKESEFKNKADNMSPGARILYALYG